MAGHVYSLELTWTGNRGTGTSGYAAYSRDYRIAVDGKPPLQGSSDPAFRGDASRWNPEELLLAAVSACHQLWYLHLAAEAGVVVTAYRDHAVATLAIDPSGGGRFDSITLRPAVTVTGASDPALAVALHATARERCFIANSLNVAVTHEPTVEVADAV